LTLLTEGVDEGKPREGAGKKEQYAKHDLDALCNAQQLLEVEEVVGVGEHIIHVTSQWQLSCRQLYYLHD